MSLIESMLMPTVLAAGADQRVVWGGLILMLVVFYAVMFSGNRKEKKKRREMLENVKKNDRVMTIGGVIATVVNVKDNEIVLKVDESTNAKVTFVRGAIQKVLADDETPSIER
ncbi:MAG: preprotein translocase subunit YajC [Phycisphaerae bacterium]|nr:preprotein translocase subunit YajC [Phycisphaerae bacterium]